MYMCNGAVGASGHPVKAPFMVLNALDHARLSRKLCVHLQHFFKTPCHFVCFETVFLFEKPAHWARRKFSPVPYTTKLSPKTLFRRMKCRPYKNYPKNKKDPTSKLPFQTQPKRPSNNDTAYTALLKRVYLSILAIRNTPRLRSRNHGLLEDSIAESL